MTDTQDNRTPLPSAVVRVTTAAEGSMAAGEGCSPAEAAANRRAAAAGICTGLARCRQVHGRRVAVVDEAFSGERLFDGYDALVSRVPGIGLMIRQADCQAVALADPVTGAVANIHSGWRGSVANIIGRTVSVLVKVCGCRPGDLHAWISPSLGPCCAEFVNYRQELPVAFTAFMVSEHHFDFWAVSRAQLQDAGLRPERIAGAGICTVCDQRYFSFRRDRTPARFATIIAPAGPGGEG